MCKSENEKVAETGMRKNRADIASHTEPSAQHHVGVIFDDRSKDAHDISRIVAPVGVDEHENVRRHIEMSEITDSREARRAVPASEFTDDVGPVLPGDFGGPVCGSVVRDDHTINPRWNGPENGRQGVLLVERRQEDGHSLTMSSVIRGGAVRSIQLDTPSRHGA